MARSHTTNRHQTAAFLQGWISRFGVPSTVTTDRGAQFENALWNSLMQILGTKRLRTTAYHPIANGLIERFHRHLKAALKCQPQPDRWMDSLPLVMLGITKKTWVAPQPRWCMDPPSDSQESFSLLHQARQQLSRPAT